MSCSHIKQINMPTEHECVEWNWAKVTNSIEEEKIYKVHRLGIHICPGKAIRTFPCKYYGLPHVTQY